MVRKMGENSISLHVTSETEFLQSTWKEQLAPQSRQAWWGRQGHGRALPNAGPVATTPTCPVWGGHPGQPTICKMCSRLFLSIHFPSLTTVNNHIIPYKNGFSEGRRVTDSKSAYIFLVPDSLFTLPWQGRSDFFRIPGKHITRTLMYAKRPFSTTKDLKNGKISFIQMDPIDTFLDVCFLLNLKTFVLSREWSGSNMTLWWRILAIHI